MARWFSLSLLVGSVCAVCTLLSSSQSHCQSASIALPASFPIVCGQPTVPLYGPWRFRIGDSPIDPATGEPLWAESSFDDSTWESVDLTPGDATFDPMGGSSGYVPGWTAKGHPGYSGYAWYRIQLRVRVHPGERLAIAGPSNVDDGYQVFANGFNIGSFGDFSGKTPATGVTEPMMFLLPQNLSDSLNSAPLLLAFRVWMHPGTLLMDPHAGGLHTAPVLGQASAVTAAYRLSWQDYIRGNALGPIAAVAFVGLALMAFSLIFFDRSDPVYLWIGIVFLLAAVLRFVGCLYLWTQLTGLTFNLISSTTVSLMYAGWSIVWWLWFGRRLRWVPWAAVVLAAVNMIALTISLEQFPLLHPVAPAFHIVSVCCRVLVFLLFLRIVVPGIRRQGLEGWVVLPAVLLLGIAFFNLEIQYSLHWFFFLFGVAIGVGDIADPFLVFTVALLLLRRLMVSIRHQRVMALDVKQAQEVQQVILPEAHTTMPGLVIESEYRPAREVGGDFFQIIPRAADDSLIIVAGDVAGKGLKAGMLVALLIGAIRSTAELNDDPVQLLRALNRRLIGRGDAQATCLALKIERNGAVRLANAGHIPPYRNGEALPMEGALPLGLIEGAEPSILRFDLEIGDKLVFLSDGIVEAADEKGELFGFDRIHDLLQKTCNVSAIAEAAQKFGQDDDISVIAVTRTA